MVWTKSSSCFSLWWMKTWAGIWRRTFIYMGQMNQTQRMKNFRGATRCMVAYMFISLTHLITIISDNWILSFVFIVKIWEFVFLLDKLFFIHYKIKIYDIPCWLILSVCFICRCGAAVNGYMYGNLPGLEMCEGDQVRWYLLGLGTNIDMHGVYFQGNTFHRNGITRDTLTVFPHTAVKVSMQPDTTGQLCLWSYAYTNVFLSK